MKRLPKSWFEGDTVDVAPKLLGKIVKYRDCSGIIVETEAYMGDPASHGFRIYKRKCLREPEKLIGSQSCERHDG